LSCDIELKGLCFDMIGDTTIWCDLTYVVDSKNVTSLLLLLWGFLCVLVINLQNFYPLTWFGIPGVDQFACVVLTWEICVHPELNLF